MRIFRHLGFVLAHGRYVARFRMEAAFDRGDAQLERSALWSREDTGSSDIISALALKANRELLLTLAGVPYDCKIAWNMRMVGGVGGIDLSAHVQRPSGGDVLLMIDGGGSKVSAARLREQTVKATRAAVTARAAMTLGTIPSASKLVLLAPWRRAIPEPSETNPLPALQREPSVLERVPAAQLWGYVPFLLRDRDETVFLALGRWAEFEGDIWDGLGRTLQPVSWESWAPQPVQILGEGTALELERHEGQVRVSLLLKAATHRASMKVDRHSSAIVRKVRAIRSACYSGHFPAGAGRFVGETVEEGVARLHWDWAPNLVSRPEAARDAVREALTLVAGGGLR